MVSHSYAPEPRDLGVLYKCGIYCVCMYMYVNKKRRMCSVCGKGPEIARGVVRTAYGRASRTVPVITVSLLHAPFARALRSEGSDSSNST